MATILGRITIDEIDVLEINGDPSATGASSSIGSIAIASGGGVWQKYGVLDTDWAKISLDQKSGKITPGAFSGSPLKAPVTFLTNFPTNNYSISISGIDGRHFLPESVTNSGFVLNTQANLSLTGLVYWSAIYNGESI